MYLDDFFRCVFKWMVPQTTYCPTKLKEDKIVE